MCIAIGKPVGIALPSEETLRTCWNNNNHGAGFAYALDSQIHIMKGYMNFEAFINDLKDLSERVDLTNIGMLLHFRIATHGKQDGTMTHPFPIIDDEAALKALDVYTNYAVVHNGIISLTSSSAKKDIGLSDTAIFIRDYLSNIACNKHWMKKNANIELIDRLIGSKMAFLDKYGNIKTTTGFHEKDGIFFSNYSYTPSTYRRGSANTAYRDYDYSYTNPTTYVQTTCPLMKVPQGTYLEVDGNSLFPEEDGYTYYIDEFDNIYIAEESEPVYSRKYYFLGVAESILDKDFKDTVIFKATLWPKKENILSFFDEDEMDVDVYETELEALENAEKAESVDDTDFVSNENMVETHERVVKALESYKD